MAFTEVATQLHLMVVLFTEEDLEVMEDQDIMLLLMVVMFTKAEDTQLPHLMVVMEDQDTILHLMVVMFTKEEDTMLLLMEVMVTEEDPLWVIKEEDMEDMEEEDIQLLHMVEKDMDMEEEDLDLDLEKEDMEIKDMDTEEEDMDTEEEDMDTVDIILNVELQLLMTGGHKMMINMLVNLITLELQLKKMETVLIKMIGEMMNGTVIMMIKKILLLNINLMINGPLIKMKI